MEGIVKLKYYYGRINRDDSVIILTTLHQPQTGLYLLRDHTKISGNFIISLIFNGNVIHYPCERTPSGKYRIPKGQEFPSPEAVIHYHSLNVSGCATLMTTPCERNGEMQALKLFGLTYSAFQKEVEGRPQPQGFFRRLLSFNLGEDKAAKKVERLVFAELHTKQPWFYPNLDREGALIHFENITNQTQTDGLFLLRINSKRAYALSLSFRGTVHHYQVCRSGSGAGVRYYLGDMAHPTKFRSLIEFVDYYHMTSNELRCKLQAPLVRPGFDDFDALKCMSLSFSCYSCASASECYSLFRSGVAGSGHGLYEVLDEEDERPRALSAEANESNTYDEAPEGHTDSENEDDSTIYPTMPPLPSSAPPPSLPPPPCPTPHSSTIVATGRRGSEQINSLAHRLTPRGSNDSLTDSMKPTIASALVTKRSLLILTAASSSTEQCKSALSSSPKNAQPKKKNSGGSNGSVNPPPVPPFPPPLPPFFARDRHMSQINSLSAANEDRSAATTTQELSPNGPSNRANNVKEVGSTDYEYDSMVATELVTIDVNSLAVGTELGGGQFGLILNGEYSTPEKKYFVALKQFRESNENSVRNANVRSEKLEELVAEARILASLNHPHIVHLFGVCWGRVSSNNENFSKEIVQDNHAILLVMELARCKSLLLRLQECSSTSTMSQKQLTLFMLQVADAMKYLHSKKILHRDLADRNILMFSPNCCKLSDFGLSRFVGNTNVYEASVLNPAMRNREFPRPVRWYSPEANREQKYTWHCDVWSFGVTCWETYSFGSSPFGDQPDFFGVTLPLIESGLRLEQPALCPSEVYALMLDCMYYKHPNDTSGRPTFEQIHQRLSVIYALLPD